MNLLPVAAIGIALAGDAFAVSVVCGASDHTSRRRSALVTSGMFGLFQMMMPILGWSVGKVGGRFAGGAGNIVAFVILSFLGIKMILDGVKKQMPRLPQGKTWMGSVLLMAAATSIDALAAGVTLPSAAGAESFGEMLEAAAVIGAITLMLSWTGYVAGRRLHRFSPAKAQLLGGVVLVSIGILQLF